MREPKLVKASSRQTPNFVQNVPRTKSGSCRNRLKIDPSQRLLVLGRQIAGMWILLRDRLNRDRVVNQRIPYLFGR